MIDSLKVHLKQAKDGRPDLAAINLGIQGRPAEYILILAKYPHSSGAYFFPSDLLAYYHEGVRVSRYD